MLRKLILVLLLLAISAAGWAASFDCTKAGTKVEKMICGDAELSKLDEKLASKYQNALNVAADRDLMKQEQREWLKVRNKCGDKNCISAAYEERIKQVGGENFSGQWHIDLCDKSISDQCGGFTVYLIQADNKICGDHFFATPGQGRINEGAPRSISGSVTDNKGAILITSGRTGAVFSVRAIKKGDVLRWEIIEEIRRGTEGDSALVLEKGNLKRETEDIRYQATLSACEDK